MSSHFYLIDIKGIAVGNEALAGTDQELEEVLFGAIKNVHNALKMLQLEEKIEVSTPNSVAVFANSIPPLYCTFKDDVLVYMKPILEFFSQINSPFYINAYPFLAYKNAAYAALEAAGYPKMEVRVSEMAGLLLAMRMKLEPLS
ncbi:hypothetical protein ZIOFF_018705 [Zingiber officinale]|uniref:Uncharacterized protein n=1 Tax=Zingiber officinale TaxID=94328 RepID=A0A8J5LIW7_ZINOF|nr:hypothetical protein ZIOFF_018705 [Zingiber officinale]